MLLLCASAYKFNGMLEYGNIGMMGEALLGE
jgi:hypothetical protein